jgi:two-component sensor histidine kinase
MLVLALSVALGIGLFIPAHVLANLSPSFFANLAVYLVAGFFTVWLGHLFRTTVRELQAEQAQRELILKEVEHRGRNMGALGAAIVHYSLKDNKEAADLINSRMKTLQATNDLITRAPKLQPEIRTIIQQELAPFGTSRYTLEGGALKLRADIARAVALIVHELVTNAVKYGALSEDDGKLAVNWSQRGDEIAIDWQEHKNSAIQASSRVGFGTQLIEATVKGMNGSAERTFGERCFTCRIVLRP